MLQHRGEPTRTGDSFEEAKIAAFELLAERAEHGQAPRGDALVRCPADKVPANPLRRFKKACAAKMLQNLGATAPADRAPLLFLTIPPPLACFATGRGAPAIVHFQAHRKKADAKR
jgi:hypothetical protein